MRRSNYELEIVGQIDRLRDSVAILALNVEIAEKALNTEEAKLKILVDIHEKATGNGKVAKKEEGEDK